MHYAIILVINNYCAIKHFWLVLLLAFVLLFFIVIILTYIWKIWEICIICFSFAHYRGCLCVMWSDIPLSCAVIVTVFSFSRMYSIYLNWLIEAMQGMWINKIIISLVSLGISIHVNYELYDLCVCIYLWCSVVRRIVRYCWLLLNLTVSVGLWS